MTLTYEQVIDLIPAYAIGALEAEETTAVDEYLQLQQELFKSLTKAEAATTLLAQGSDHASMAPDAKNRMMKRINADLSARGLPASDVGDTSVSNETKAGLKLPPEPSRAVADNGHSHSHGHGLNNRPKQRRPRNQRQQIQRHPSANRRQITHTGRPLAHRPANTQQGRVISGRAGQRVPMDLFPPPPKRRFMGGIFSSRAVINATMVASVVTLLFMSLLNLQSETQVRQLTATASADKTRMAQSEAQISDLNNANVSLSNANSTLVTQNSRFIDEQAELSTENSELRITNEKIQNARTELLTELTNLETTNKEIAIERAALFEENARLQNQLANNEERIALVGAASQATVMFGTDEAPGLQGTFFKRDEVAELVVHGLVPLQGNQAYQFWLVTENGEQISAGLFNVDPNQEPTWASLQVPQSADSYSLVGISIEPAEGSETPTGPMLLESVPISEAPPESLG